MQTITLSPEAQVNDAGDVALRYYQEGQVFIDNMPSGKQYVAATRANICLVWVDPQDAEAVLARRGGCCNRQRQLFHYANESDVRRWTNNGGR